MVDDIIEMAETVVEIAAEIGGAVLEKRKQGKELREREDEERRKADRVRPL